MTDFVMLTDGRIDQIDLGLAYNPQAQVAGAKVRKAWEEGKHARGFGGKFGHGTGTAETPKAPVQQFGGGKPVETPNVPYAYGPAAMGEWLPPETWKSMDQLQIADQANLRDWVPTVAKEMGLGVSRMDDGLGFHHGSMVDNAPTFDPSLAVYTATSPSSEALAAHIGKRRGLGAVQHFTPKKNGKDALFSIGGSGEEAEMVLARANELGIVGAQVVGDNLQFAAGPDDKATVLKAVQKLHEEDMLNGQIKLTRGDLKFFVRDKGSKWRSNQETYDDVLKRHQPARPAGSAGGTAAGAAANGRQLGEHADAERLRAWLERGRHYGPGDSLWLDDGADDPWADAGYGVELGELPIDPEFEGKHKRGHGGKFTTMFGIGKLKQGMRFRFPGDKTRHIVVAGSNTHSWSQDEHGNFKSVANEVEVEPHPDDVKALKGSGTPPFPKASSKPYVPPPPPPPPADIGGEHGEPLLEHEKAAGGSNGAYFAKDPNGTRWLVKTYRGDTDRVATEKLANSVYQQMGFPVADAQILHDKKGRPVLAYPLLEGDTRKLDEPSQKLGEGFMTDALVGNWDVVGLSDDNVLWNDAGEPMRIDQGGTFQFRAMGGNKEFGPIPTEVWSMLGLKKDGRTTQAQRGMIVTDQMKREQAAAIADKLSPSVVDHLIDDAPFKDETMREEVRDALKSRVEWMRRFADGEESLPPGPPDGDQAATLANEPMQLTADEMKAFEVFNLHAAHINDLLRADDKDAIRPLLTHMDGALKDAKLPEAITAYRAMEGTLPLTAQGKVLTDKGYTRLTVDADSLPPDATLVRVLLPKGSSALGLGLVGGDARELLTRRDGRFTILSVNEVDGRTIVEAQMLPEYSAPKPWKPLKGAAGKPSDAPKLPGLD